MRLPFSSKALHWVSSSVELRVAGDLSGLRVSLDSRMWTCSLRGLNFVDTPSSPWDKEEIRREIVVREPVSPVQLESQRGLDSDADPVGDVEGPDAGFDAGGRDRPPDPQDEEDQHARIGIQQQEKANQLFLPASLDQRVLAWL